MASNRIKGLTVEIGGDVSKLSSALASVDGQIKTSSKSLKDIDRLLKLDPKNVELLEQKSRALSSAIDGTKERLEKLRAAQAQAEPNLQYYDAWQAKIAPINLDIEKVSESIRSMRKEQKSLEADSDAFKEMSEKIAEAEKKLKELKKAKKAADDEFHNPLSPEQYEALRREVIDAENSLQRLERSLSETEDAARDAGEAIEDSGADARGASKDVDTLGNSLDDLKGKLGDAKEAAKDAWADLGKAGAAGAAAVGVALNPAMGREDALASIQTQTGASDAEMQSVSAAMDAVYRAGYGEDLDDVASAAATVSQLTGKGGSADLSELTQDAIALRDAFGYETQESIRGAKMLVDQFGVSYHDAFEMIAQGAQNGLNRSGDLLDIINEYSVHYKYLGYSAEEFFNSLQNGADAGAFSVDKLGDATKEFGIRTKDNSTATREAYERLHLDADLMGEKFAAGGESAREAGETVLSALLRMDDQVAQNEIGVALFGTMWEDLGIDAVAAMTDVSGSIDVTKGKLEEIKEVKYDTVSSEWKRVGRTLQAELLVPLGEKLLPTAQKLGSYLVKNLDKILPTVKAIATTAAAMFAGKKIGTAIQSTVKLVQAYKALKTATTAANAAMSATPWGAVGTALGFVVGGLYSLISAENEAAEAEQERVRELERAAEEQTQAYRDIAESARDSAQARREAAGAVNDEFDRYGDLWRELEKLVDAEGNVIAGNADRVNQIRGEFSEAMGEEIELVDGQIQKYGELRDTIADTLALKRVEALSQKYKSDYDAAKENLSAQQMEYERYLPILSEYYEHAEGLAQAQSKLMGIKSFADPEYLMTLEEIGAHRAWLYDEEHPERANAAENARLAREAYDTSLATIALYDELTAAMYSGDTEAMLAAAEAMEQGIVESSHGAAYSTLLAQADDLYQDWQALATSSQNEGSTVTQAQLDDMAELVARAVYEAYIDADAEGASQEELDTLLSMLEGLGYGEYLENLDEHLYSVETFMQYLDGPESLAGTIVQESGGLHELLRGVISAIDDKDLAVVLDGELIARKLAPRVNNALGTQSYYQGRGQLIK